MAHRIGEVDTSFAVGQRLIDHVPILDGDVRQPEKLSQDSRALLLPCRMPSPCRSSFGIVTWPLLVTDVDSMASLLK